MRVFIPVADREQRLEADEVVDGQEGIAVAVGGARRAPPDRPVHRRLAARPRELAADRRPEVGLLLALGRELARLRLR